MDIAGALKIAWNGLSGEVDWHSRNNYGSL